MTSLVQTPPSAVCAVCSHVLSEVLSVAGTSTESNSFFITALINGQLLATEMPPSSQTQCSSFFKNVNVCQQLLHRGIKNPWERSAVSWMQKQNHYYYLLATATFLIVTTILLLDISIH